MSTDLATATLDEIAEVLKRRGEEFVLITPGKDGPMMLSSHPLFADTNRHDDKLLTVVRDYVQVLLEASAKTKAKPVVTIPDILAAMAKLSAAQRTTLFGWMPARWCSRCAREREQGAAGCECGKAFREEEDRRAWRRSWGLL